MRGGIFYHGVIAALLLGAAACGGKDKEKADKNAAANELTSEATPRRRLRQGRQARRQGQGFQ